MTRLCRTLLAVVLGTLAVGAPAADAAPAGRIAFVFGGQIQTVNADGTDRRAVTAIPGLSVEDLAVSPDGRWIAFTTNNADLYAGEGFGLYVVSSQGSPLLALTADKRALVAHERDPSWSPDGAKLAFSGFDPATETRELFTIGADGRALTRMTSVGGVYDVAWSPAGDRIAFAGDADDQKIMTVPPTATTAGAPTPIYNGALTEALEFAPDGSEIAFTSDTYYIDAVHADGSPYADGSTRRHIVWDDEPACPSTYCWGRMPAWSPDGTTIAYARPDANIDRQVALVAQTGVNPNQTGWGITSLTSEAGDKSDLDWGPTPAPDVEKPTARITSGPGKVRKRAKFTFAAGEPLVAFTCRLDKRKPTSCASPLTYKNLRRGSHRFSVVATDWAGNASSAATRKFTTR